MLTRRTLLERAATGVAATALGSQLPGFALASAATKGAIALPTPAQVRADYQRMVDFGPRLTGSKAHENYIAWLEREFVNAGASLLRCDNYEYERWTVDRFGLDVLDGATPGAVEVASYYTRSQETPAEGITGPLVYGGVLPAPSISAGDIAGVAGAIARYPADLAAWAAAAPGRLGATDGALLVVDLPMPVPITAGVFLSIAQYLHWPGHTAADWATIDYKRSWIMPGLGVPLAPFEGMGAAGVIFIVDSSWEALENNYLPFDHGHEPVPALYVDREVGRALRTQSGARPKAKLTLTASRQKVQVPSITAILPGESDECVIINTHTDGQGFVEENGGVAFVHLARHFGSLPASERLKRTLVFAAWPGHMSGALPELQGWMAAHPDLVKRAAAAMTIEHLGCSEWIDSADKGYHATGENETFGVWVSPGKYFDVTRDALTAQGDVMGRTALLRPGVQFGVGGAFESAGIPQIGAIAGPEYLLTIKDNGDMDKLDEKLAAAQTAWLADILKRIEPISAEELRAGDPFLGSTKPDVDKSTKAQCGPDDRFIADAGGGHSLLVRFYGRRHKPGGVVVSVAATGAAVAGLTVELRRHGKLVARSKQVRAADTPTRLVLRRRDGRKFLGGSYELVVRKRGKVVSRRDVRLRSTPPQS